MAIEIDNKKFWESIFRNHPSEQDWINICDIKLALKAQGLIVNDKGEIIPIEPEIKWYVALNDYGHYDNTIISAVPLFLKGERTTKENVFNMCKDIMGYEITEEEFNENFRPATETEIPQTNSTKPYNPLKEQRVATNHIESKPEPKKCLFTKEEFTDEERKELCGGCQEECELNKNIPMFKEVERNGKDEPKQRKASGVLKKMLDNLDEESLAKTREKMLEETELTDFEKVLAECIHHSQGNVISPEFIALQWSDALMAEARKQIASEIDATQMAREIRITDFKIPTLGAAYYQGIVNTIKKIKGESI